jgi:hypothetical protein
MERFLTDPPLPLSPTAATGEFSAAQLVFYDVDHSGASYEALVFLNAPEANVGTPLDAEAGFAGSFVIFGHGGCVGGEGHCDSSVRPADPFDNRPLHPLTPQTKLVDVSAALERARAEGDMLTVTVLAVVPGQDAPRLADVLSFSAMRLVAFD